MLWPQVQTLKLHLKSIQPERHPCTGFFQCPVPPSYIRLIPEPIHALYSFVIERAVIITLPCSTNCI